MPDRFESNRFKTAHETGATGATGVAGATGATATPAGAPVSTRPWSPHHMRRRAAMDAVLLLGLAGLAMLFFHDKGMEGTLLIVGLMTAGSILFVVRRGLDFTRLAEEQHQLESRTRGLGISLADWQSGVELPPWHERTFQRDVSESENTTRTLPIESL